MASQVILSGQEKALIIGYLKVSDPLGEQMISDLGLSEAQASALRAAADVTPPPLPVPQSVTPRQARLALAAEGLLASVNAAVAASDEATQITWEFATEVERSNPIIASMAAQLSLTDAQVDDLFRAASAL